MFLMPRMKSPGQPRFALLLTLLLALPALASEVGSVTHLSGTLRARTPEGSVRLLSVKSAVNNGELLITQENTYARVKFLDGAEVVLRPESQFAVNDVRYQAGAPASDNFSVNLVKGGLRMVTGLLGKRNPERVNVSTTTATIGIRGTHFGLLMCQADCGHIPTPSGLPPADGLHIDVADGAIRVANRAGEQLLTAGQFGYVQSAATPPSAVPPRQGIQVTMPANISQNNTAGRSLGQSHDAAECAVQ